MRQEHLSSLDYEKYLEEDDLSEEYLTWLEPVAEHLMYCESCQRLLQKIMKIECICEEGPMGISDVANKEDSIKKLVLTETIKDMYKDNSDEATRMQQIVDRIKKSYIEPVRRAYKQITDTREGWYRTGRRVQGQACQISRTSPAGGRELFVPDFIANQKTGKDSRARIKDISYEYGYLVVGVEAPKGASGVTVILHGKNYEVLVKNARLYREADAVDDDDLWLANIECTELAEYYDIYVDII